jgi:hypothetical protein
MGWLVRIPDSLSVRRHLGLEGSQEVDDDGLELGIGVLAELTLGADGVQQILLRASQVLQELGLELGDLARLELVQVTAHTGVDNANLLLNRQWYFVNKRKLLEC